MKQINGCLFVGEFGVFMVYCVFEVQCVRSVHNFKIGERLEVSEVKLTDDSCIIYNIKKCLLLPSLF